MLKSGKLLLCHRHPFGRILERSRWNIIPFPRDRWKNGILERSRWNIIPFPRDMWKNGMSDK